jgi:RNA polymerase sigma-70 factor (ECF subfamily)
VVSKSAVRADTGRVLTELYKQHSAEAFRYALHLTGRRADAEDVVQQAFLQAHRHLEMGRELMSPRAWLLTAVKHRAYNLARDGRELPVDQATLPAQPREASRDEAAELAEVRGMLWTLPEAQHQAFVLRHWSGLSQNEIAAVLETTPAAVESLLVRARSALVRVHESASETCSRVRSRLLDSAALATSDDAHIGSCRECRHAHARLARAANLAGSLALVPGTHVADSLARLVPGFSAHAATSTAAAAGTGVGAGAGSGAGGRRRCQDGDCRSRCDGRRQRGTGGGACGFWPRRAARRIVKPARRSPPHAACRATRRGVGRPRRWDDRRPRSRRAGRQRSGTEPWEARR